MKSFDTPGCRNPSRDDSRQYEQLADTTLESAEGNQEFFVGLSDEDVFENTDPTAAAVSAVVGTSRE